MRNMSFMLTEEQIMNETQHVVRKLGWWFLERHDVVCAVKKGMGLKKGEKVVRLKTIIILSTFPQELNKITVRDVELEGFPGKSPEWFIDFFCTSHKRCFPNTIVNVINFTYFKTWEEFGIEVEKQFSAYQNRKKLNG
jgi:hypothetical protein